MPGVEKPVNTDVGSGTKLIWTRTYNVELM